MAAETCDPTERHNRLMHLVRLVIIIAVLWFAMRVVRRIMHAAAARKTALGYQGKMVLCNVCGVYLPQHDALRDADGKFSCDTH